MPVVRAGSEGLHHARSDFLGQRVQRAALPGRVRVRVPHLGDQSGRAVMPDAPGEAARIVVEQFGRQYGLGVVPWSWHRLYSAPLTAGTRIAMVPPALAARIVPLCASNPAA